MQRFFILATLFAVGVVALLASRVHAEQAGGLFPTGVPTLGGRFVWSDEVVDHGWRVQKNAVIGHYRLLDDHDRRQAFGSFDTCLAKLNEEKKAQNFPPNPKDVVIVLHGLGAGRQFMEGLAEYLEENGNLATINVGYPSTMEDVDAYAASLDSVIRHLDGVERVSFVAHSMGNIVIRRYLNNMSRLDPAMRPPVEFKRMVMISPPNHGAELADAWADNKLVETVAGKPLEQLAPSKGWPELEKQLSTPDFPFGIIVGGRGDAEGYFDAIPGDDDGLLSIETSKLAGASDYIQTLGIHQLMPQYKEVRAAALNFLLHGYFVSPQAMHPIVAAK
ncbi:esterase/lipase family protein [Lacipirellula sp.]|uniref:esterase/lipase family protein n=1 Tax=Lacipirellula sp. TaxID=2691419 RepID=UPI003D0C9BB4